MPIQKILSVALVAALVLPPVPLGARASEELPAGTRSDEPAPARPPTAPSVGVRFGNETAEGFVDLLQPLWAGEDGVLLLNPRFSLRDEGENEANVGLAYRQLLPDLGTIVGVNAYFDTRESRHGNRFDQLGLGAEVLTEWVDGRINVYLPDDDEKLVARVGTTEVAVATAIDTERRRRTGAPVARGNRISQRTTTTTTTTTTTNRTTTNRTFEQFEAALEGWDAEIGVRLPLGDVLPEVRVFGGWYDFDAAFGRNVEGPKGRLEIRAPYVTLDAEIFDDEELNGTDWFAGFRVHLPLDLAALVTGDTPSADPRAGTPRALRERLATDMVMRDVRIQTRESALEENPSLGSQSQETTVDVQTSSVGSKNEVTNVTFVDDGRGGAGENGTAENPFDGVGEGADAANPGAIVEHDPSNDRFTVFVFDGTYSGENVTLGTNQTLTSTVTLPSGAVFAADGRPMILGGTGLPAITTGVASRIERIDVTGATGQPAIAVPGGATLTLVDVTATGGAGASPGGHGITIADMGTLVASNSMIRGGDGGFGSTTERIDPELFFGFDDLFEALEAFDQGRGGDGIRGGNGVTVELADTTVIGGDGARDPAADQEREGPVPLFQIFLEQEPGIVIAGSGGTGIRTGDDATIVVARSTVRGGQGTDVTNDFSDVFGAFGGDAIWADDGATIEVTDSAVFGGHGGALRGIDEPGSGRSGGEAGYGVFTGDEATVVVTRSTVAGGDGGLVEGDGFNSGGSGGDGIGVGDRSSVTVVDSPATIRGGRGGDVVSGAGGDKNFAGNGGDGIFAGDDATIVVTTSRVVGGDGGDGEGNLQTLGGDGGDGIFATRRATIILTDAVVAGGNGGDLELKDSGNLSFNFGGDGGDGVSTVDDAVIVVTRSTVSGGNGGNVLGVDMGDSVNFGGDGGDGIAGSDDGTIVVQGSTILGGKGGAIINADSDNEGGDGGHGIHLHDRATITVTASTVLGGEGGAIVDSGDDNQAGDGGHGIDVGDAATITILDAPDTVRGGDGGASTGNAFGNNHAGDGGNGIDTGNDAVITVTRSTLAGGAGGRFENGDDSSSDLSPGDGGDALDVGHGSFVRILLSRLFGGTGGGTDEEFGSGGAGGRGLDGRNDSNLDVEITDSIVTGGTGGAAPNGTGGPGGPAVDVDGSSGQVVCSGSTITGGEGGSGLKTRGGAPGIRDDNSIVQPGDCVVVDNGKRKIRIHKPN